MEDIFRHKQTLRALLKKKRDSILRQEVEEKSAQITAHLEALHEFISARTVHTYVAWRNEVNTHDLIRRMLAQGKRVVVPSVDLARHILVHHEIENFADLLPGAFGILEPAPGRGKIVQIDSLDLVLVPAIAVDKTGHRLGYGGGYYDHFLRDVPALKIALVYHFQLVDVLPVRKDDERVDVVVTEEGVFRVG